jgi:hypothetical protein
VHRFLTLLSRAPWSRELRRYLERIDRRTEINAVLAGQMLTRALPGVVDRLQDAEFRVFSQFGDDGIIQYLIRTIRPANDSFVEFGVGDYSESNTRFLLLHNNWRGLIMDGSSENMERVRSQELYWRHDLVAKAAFVTSDNVNALISSEGMTGEIGLLHIDVDGNDYWLWRAIDVVSPEIVIMEYNAVFGSDRAITVPYAPDFRRFAAHYSGLFFGASLPALCDLAHAKGYSFVGCNSAGNNAYFVRNDRMSGLKPLAPTAGFVESRFREARTADGQLSYVRGSHRRELIAGLTVFNTRSQHDEPF